MTHPPACRRLALDQFGEALGVFQITGAGGCERQVVASNHAINVGIMESSARF